MENTGFKNAFEYKVIYVWTAANNPAYNGYVKIGDATVKTELSIDMLSPNCRELNQAALARIKSYTNTAGLTPKMLHTELAIRQVKGEDGEVKNMAFRDHQVHAVLKNSGIDNIEIGETTGKEWFEIDVETAKKAIEAVKQGYANLSNTDVVKHAPIIFRPEQAECITKVVKHFKKADRFLINAKMRYGKTFVSLEIVKQCGFEKTIIMTHRPVVDAGWYEDFTKIFADKKDYIYGSKASGYTMEDLLKKGQPFIYFASVQDLRGSEQVGGKFDKNNVVFDTVWDCVIVDEAHEGTTTALGEDTVKAVVKEGSGTKFLALSGTPFNILTDYDEDSIYTWDYIMEQECKSEWDKLHFGDSNPYDELPELRIYTYDLGDILHNSNYITFEDKAFNFHEFFRTWTGDFSRDYADMPEGATVGDFVHETDVSSFLYLLTKEDEKSSYPFSNKEYRELFKHTLWMVPGVREAKALKKLMLKNNIFGNGQFDIVNVAGDGDEEEKSEEALKKVRKAIKSAGKDGYTITLSCGKLTTGVTVKEWTAVFMLAGSFSTSAANYLQTIFRVQSPCNEDGKIKETSYVFDFAPDRTLKMVSSAVSVSAKAGKKKEGDAAILGKFLNYCPVIAVSGSEMKEYSATKLLQQLKRAYADKVVRNGFDDSSLYNDELFKLQDADIAKFDELKGIIGTSKAAAKQQDITVNDQGLTNEEYEQIEKLQKKPKKQLTEEEKARLEELKKMKKLRNDAISILRGISIRMPLLIYGADIPYDEEITLDRFVELVDDNSWEEFMPRGVTKDIFKEFQQYYDEEIFIAAGRRIRNIAREADTYDPTDRVMKIAGLFKYFKNPDRETVLTPWRVVNMHMSDCLGGWDFFGASHSDDDILDNPRFVDQGKVTRDVFQKPNTQILEINSKTGLYPLYVTYSVYCAKLNLLSEGEKSLEKQRELWFETVSDNIFVVCKTPMAKSITQRTLNGYSDRKINAHYFDDLINTMANKPDLFLKRVLSKNYWKKGEGKMKFDAIVGNPPYMSEVERERAEGSAAQMAMPIFNLFVDQAIKIKPEYLSMIIPARWYSGGIGLNDFRERMLHDRRISKLYDFSNSRDCFSTVNIAGGICYFLWEALHNDICEVTNISGLDRNSVTRPLDAEEDIFIRSNMAISILEKIKAKTTDTFQSQVLPRNPFNFGSNARGSDTPFKGCIKLIHSKGIGYLKRSDVTKNQELIDRYKVYISPLIPCNGEVGIDPAKGYKSITTPRLLVPGEICTDSYIVIGTYDTYEEAIEFSEFMTCKLPRYLLRITYSSMHVGWQNFRYLPKLNMKEKWTDKKLYAHFNLNDKEISVVEKTMRTISLSTEDSN